VSGHPPRPPWRARRGSWRAARYLALDFETTGLDRAVDRIVSFGAIPVDGPVIRLGEATHEVVDPGDRGPSRTSVQIHGLRPVDVAGAMPADEARRRLADLLERRYLLAWYAPVETGFLAVMFGDRVRRWSGRTIDVRDLLAAFDGAPATRAPLSEAARSRGVPVADPHHALDDALVTAQLFLVLASRLEAAGRIRSVGDLLRLPRAA
jgi:DNA polymerase-3 subunit epsilon